MTQHYKGKRQSQARARTESTVLVACFATGERAFIPLADRSDAELTDDIRYCNSQGAVSYHTEPMSDAIERECSAEFERIASVFDDGRKVGDA